MMALLSVPAEVFSWWGLSLKGHMRWLLINWLFFSLPTAALTLVCLGLAWLCFQTGQSPAQTAGEMARRNGEAGVGSPKLSEPQPEQTAR
jgi:hypothetical protein